MNKKLIAFDQNLRQEFQTTLISGSDEAGRGAMAGPIVVASVVLPSEYQNCEIIDSKLIKSEFKRQQLAAEIFQHALDVQIEIIDHNLVDQLNPKQASRLGMINSINKLKLMPTLALTDGEDIADQLKIQTMRIFKGDNTSQSIAAASIIAKVTRDNIMNEYETKYPDFAFSKHKGYCTKRHYLEVEEHGVLEIHRKTYRPIKKYL